MESRAGLCEVDGCDGARRARGWCWTHYKRWQKTGSVQDDVPVVRISRGVPLEERLLAQCDRSGDCWLWTGDIDRDGYGRMSVNNQNTGTHRVAFAIWKNDGVILRLPMSVDHQCHTLDETCVGGQTCLHRRCINPDHLEAMLLVENVAQSNAPTGRKAIAARRALART